MQQTWLDEDKASTYFRNYSSQFLKTGPSPANAFSARDSHLRLRKISGFRRIIFHSQMSKTNCLLVKNHDGIIRDLTLLPKCLRFFKKNQVYRKDGSKRKLELNEHWPRRQKKELKKFQLHAEKNAEKMKKIQKTAIEKPLKMVGTGVEQ
ncbi:hypothetical protein [Pedobacter agri]|uniref:hypothetical protein n=1 Tax=Pedobacter agri TaxID=454586 RepID=UPI002931710C|nr:hypothetical protein [Pedobacter agri]